MLVKSLRFQLIWRVGLLLLLGLASLYLVLFTPFWLSALWTGLAFVSLVVGLIRFLERRHRDLEQFLQAVSQSDFSQQTMLEHDPLAPHYAQIRALFGQLRSEKASQHAYLQQVVEHIEIALLGYDDEGHVSLMNRAARSLFQKPYLHKIQALQSAHPALWALLQDLPGGARKVIELDINGLNRSFAVQASYFKLLERPYQLVSLQDISRELQAQELDAWEKLIRVLTHEITNSVIPIATLGQIAQEMVAPDKSLAAADWDDLRQSLATITRRSQGLADFVARYRKLAGLPAPQVEEVSVSDLLAEVQQLLMPQLTAEGVGLSLVDKSGGTKVQADQAQVMQVLINLVLNARDAALTHPQPAVRINVLQPDAEYIDVEISDNGPGISDTLQARIFIPFFSTKAAGSGIGLSLARQIMWRHGGDVAIAQTGGLGTTMRVRMPRHPSAALPYKTTFSASDPSLPT